MKRLIIFLCLLSSFSAFSQYELRDNMSKKTSTIDTFRLVSKLTSTSTSDSVWVFRASDSTMRKMAQSDISGGGGGGANTALSNLASVAINTSLISDADNTDDLGSSSNAWKDAYMYSLKLKGSSSGTATITPLSAAGTTSIYLPTSNGHLVNFFSANESGSVSAPASWGGARTNLYNLSGLSSNATFAAPGGTPLDGNLLYIRVQDNGTSRTLAWNPIFDEGDDLPLPTSTVTGKGMRLQFSYNDATSKWELIGYTGGF